MSTGTGIEWTEATWNPVVGCTPVSPGCLNCYAATMARRLEAMGRPEYVALTVKRDERAVFNGTVRCLEDRLEDPLHWRKPRRIFVNSMSDLFHESVSFNFIDRVFAVMAMCQQHTFQVLTKRPERMAEYLAGKCAETVEVMVDRLCGAQKVLGPIHIRASEIFNCGDGVDWPLPNVWLGTSVEDQSRADERIPYLLHCPAVVRFLSCEPLLGPVDLREMLYPSTDFAGVQWVIVGGESGHRSRPCNVEWVRSIVRQCSEAGVPCFVKQLGAMPMARVYDAFHGEVIGTDRWRGITDKKGGDPSEWPEDLRVREFPEEAA